MRRLLPIVAIAAGLAAAPGAHAQGGQLEVLGAKGKRGSATVYQGRCKYGVFGPRGVLQVGEYPPLVSGANTRRRTRRERTRVRYRVKITNALNGYTPIATSSWSSFIRVRQNQRKTWNGFTGWDMDWQGGYGLDVRIEWWNSRRRIGWRTYRLNAFQFYDQYNRGPYGPITYCYKYTVN